MNKLCLKALIVLFMLSPICSFAQEVSLKELYGKKQQALKTLDINEVSKYISSDLLSAIKKEKDPKGTLFLMDYHSPKEYDTGKEVINGNTATMEIKGRARNPQLKGVEDNFTGIINFKKEGNSWKIVSEDIKYATPKNKLLKTY